MRLSRNPSPGSQMSPFPQCPNHRAQSGAQTWMGHLPPTPELPLPPEREPKRAGGACLPAEKAKKRSLGLRAALPESVTFCAWGRWVGKMPPAPTNRGKYKELIPSTLP